MRSAGKGVKASLDSISDAVSRVVRWIIGCAPFGIMGLVFTTVSESGLSIFKEYGKLLLVLVGAMLTVALIVDPLLASLFLKKNAYPLAFRCLRESGVTAFFTRSSAANIPVNMSLCKRLGLDPDIYSVSIPLGATINMDGAAITLSLIRTTKILYDVTQHNDVTLDDSDMETTNNTIDNFLGSMPDGLLEKYGISEDVVRKVFTEQTYVSKFENDIKNDMGKKVQSDIEEKVKDYNFTIFDYILFPTVETTEDDVPATNTDGSYKYVSDDAKEKAKENAEALLEELKAGGDAASLAQKYGVSNYYFERTGYVGSFTDSVNKAVENLKAGECSGVLEEELGYAVIHMQTDHDEELLKNYAYAVASDTVDSQFEKLETQWLSSIEVDPEKDMEGTVWADYDLSGLAQSLADGGLLNGASSTSSAGSN